MINEGFDSTHDEYRKILREAYDSIRASSRSTELEDLRDFLLDNMAAACVNFTAISEDMKYIVRKLKIERADDDRFTPYN